MALPRIIELSVCFLLAFVVLVVFSFFSLRPSLNEFRDDAKGEWDAFLVAVKERNRMLPGLVEAVQAFESGHSKLAEKMLAARAISMNSSDPKRVVAAVNSMEALLLQVDKLAQSRPEMAGYPPFVERWKRVVPSTSRANHARKSYNKSVRAYNRLLDTFPQNLIATVFGFVPLDDYPAVRTVAGLDRK
jgi:LemA protein